MRIEKGHSNIYRITLSGYELAALISSARWVAEGGEGQVTPDVANNLKQLLVSYDDATKKLHEKSPQEKSLK